MHDPVAFRCRGKMGDGSDCGHLLPAVCGGEMATPTACPVCRAGVEFDVVDQEGRAKLREEMIVAAREGNEVMVDAVMRRLSAMQLKKTFRPDNWEVLANATPERLAELGLEPHHVQAHVPFKTEWKFNEVTDSHEPVHTPLDVPLVPVGKTDHKRSAIDSPGTRDKGA